MTNRSEQVRILTKSQEFVRLLTFDGEENIHVRWPIRHIQSLARQLRSCHVIKVPRQHVREARQLALWCQAHRMASYNAI